KTKFPLLGKHRAPVKCVACHKGDLFKDKLQMTCVSCHKKEDDKAHKGNFGPKCETCHAERDWKEILFDHTKQTKYPLLAKHKDVKCVTCHKGDLYKDKLQTTCVSCHKKDDDKAHTGNFGIKCEACHVEKGWKEIHFDHGKTKFPLLGKHQSPLKCVSCHKGDLYKDKLPMDCFSCHEKDDKHKGQEGKKCETCHNEKDWKTTTFKHNSMSKFPLLGGHAVVEKDCKKCHLAVTFKDAKSDCWSCHEKDDTKIHKRRFGTECQECHNVRSWKSWDFDHDKTRFKLNGPHKNIPNCYRCHDRPMEKKVRASQTCGGCHDRDDVHNGDFGPQCDRCHIGDKWKDLRIGAGR
ncbi:MAG: cytochrome c3 family protein, partial [Gallionellaceae bacterium]|nr:cytochrome c3 family protein [Gallionellaceae bacterium]